MGFSWPELSRCCWPERARVLNLRALSELRKPLRLVRDSGLMKAIRLSAHASSYGASRGFTLAEIEEAIRESRWGPAELGRMECRKVFPFNRQWNGKRYANKEVRPIFVEEADEIVVVTVYTYYF